MADNKRPTRTIAFRVDNALHDELAAIAAHKHMSMSDLIRDALDTALAARDEVQS